MIKFIAERVLVFAGLTASLLCAQGYRQARAIDIGGSGGWDYLTVDSPSHRLYVSHETEVVVVDLRSNKIVGRITGLNRVHGIALAPDLDTGYISDSGANQVIFFSLAKLQVTRKVAAGTNPDGIVFDSPSNRVFAFNGRTQNVTAINASTGAVDGTVALGGKPEFPVSDGKGRIYDNVEDKSEIVHIDSKTL